MLQRLSPILRIWKRGRKLNAENRHDTETFRPNAYLQGRFGSIMGREPPEEHEMKWAGFLLLLAGWVILILALVLLSSAGLRFVFVVAGLLVELLGLFLAGRDHRTFAGGLN